MTYDFHIEDGRLLDVGVYWKVRKMRVAEGCDPALERLSMITSGNRIHGSMGAMVDGRNQIRSAPAGVIPTVLTRL